MFLYLEYPGISFILSLKQNKNREQRAMLSEYIVKQSQIITSNYHLLMFAKINSGTRTVYGISNLKPGKYPNNSLKPLHERRRACGTNTKNIRFEDSYKECKLVIFCTL